MAVVNVRLQVTLGQVGPLAALHDTAHVQRAALALLDALHLISATVHGEAENRARYV